MAYFSLFHFFTSLYELRHTVYSLQLSFYIFLTRLEFRLIELLFLTFLPGFLTILITISPPLVSFASILPHRGIHHHTFIFNRVTFFFATEIQISTRYPRDGRENFPKVFNFPANKLQTRQRNGAHVGCGFSVWLVEIRLSKGCFHPSPIL